VAERATRAATHVLNDAFRHPVIARPMTLASEPEALNPNNDPILQIYPIGIARGQEDTEPLLTQGNAPLDPLVEEHLRSISRSRDQAFEERDTAGYAATPGYTNTADSNIEEHFLMPRDPNAAEHVARNLRNSMFIAQSIFSSSVNEQARAGFDPELGSGRSTPTSTSDEEEFRNELRRRYKRRKSH